MRLKHPITRADYARNDDGTVTVEGRSGSGGTFDRKGRWLSGDLRTADAMMCMFVADGFRLQPGGAPAGADSTLHSGADA